MTLPLFNGSDIKIRVNDRSTHCCLAVLLKVQSIRDVVCYTKRNVIVGQHTIESRVGCEKIHHLVILNVTCADCAKCCLCEINKHDGMYGNNNHIYSGNYCAWLCCFLVGETMKKHNGIFNPLVFNVLGKVTKC